MSTTEHCGDIDGHGLASDLKVLMARRRILGVFGLAGASLFLDGCDFLGPRGQSEPNRTGVAADGTVCLKDPAETNGPFPADGSNTRHGSTINALTQSGIMRSDIRPSFGGMTPVAVGTRLDLEITLLDVAKDCAPPAGHAVYVWHCDAGGKYSLYDSEDRNYLRGVGLTDTKGRVSFTTIFPGCYPGRWPHIHFEVFASEEKAGFGKDSLLISQFAMPGEIASALYRDRSIYGSSDVNLVGASLAKDNVFGDNTPEQLAIQTVKIEGDAASGLKSNVTVGIASS